MADIVILNAKVFTSDKENPWADGRGIKYGIVSSRQELDEIISDRPIYINTYDGCDVADAEFMEHEKGQIKEGYLADLVLFSHDLFALNPKDVLQAKAVMTIVNGKIVFEESKI